MARDRKHANEYGKVYYAANREKVLARQKARGASEHGRAINRQAVAKYRATHKAEISAKQREASVKRYAKDIDKARADARRRYHKNIERARAKANEYGTAHAEERAKRAAKWRVQNPERTEQLRIEGWKRRKEHWTEFLEQERQRYQRSYQLDPGKYTAKGAKRRAAQLLATPPWCDLDEIMAIYRRAQQLSLETGVKHDVDHIIPLRGKNVCGLHIPINLQIITGRENRKKSNKTWQSAPPLQSLLPHESGSAN